VKTYTIDDIRALGPCYDPSRYLPEDWTGTAIDILKMENVPPADRLWVVSYWLDDRTLRLFAVWCARESLKLIDNPDPRLIAACNVAERYARYADGEATDEELEAAWDAALATARVTALDAARSAALDTAQDIACYAALDAARSVARSAALDTAQDIACYAALDTAQDIACYAALDAAQGVACYAALDAAQGVAQCVAWDAQINHLITMIEEAKP